MSMTPIVTTRLKDPPIHTTQTHLSTKISRRSGSTSAAIDLSDLLNFKKDATKRGKISKERHIYYEQMPNMLDTLNESSEVIGPSRKSKEKETKRAISKSTMIKSEVLGADDTSIGLRPKRETTVGSSKKKKLKRETEDNESDYSETERITSRKTSVKKKSKQSTKSTKNSKKKGNANQKKRKLNKKAEEPVEEDFSRIKPKDQTLIGTFWNAVDLYAKPLSEGDQQYLEKLLDQSYNHKFYEIPPLGRHWEDTKVDDDLLSDRGEPFDEVIDEDSLGPELKYGTLSSRLLTGLISEKSEIDVRTLGDNVEKEVNGFNSMKENTSSFPQLGNLEDSLKAELQFAGIFSEEEDLSQLAPPSPIPHPVGETNDEVLGKLIGLQEALKQQAKVNQTRLSKLISKIPDHIAYRQFSDLMDQLDKDIEDSYVARFMPAKAKKKKQAVPDFRYCLERRKRFEENIGTIFNPEEFQLPTASIFAEDLEILNS
ncbi:hypothetical protein G9A89_019728 [Geosiphon pyriformis]|nr:hypothetical protein G9A89_019728 [Geosiphon pyriformis]